MRVLPVMAMVLVAATACGSPSGAGGERACTMIGAQVGIGLDLEPAAAAKVGSATLVACWASTCDTQDLVLSPSTAAASTTCTGDKPTDSCSARMTPTGGKHGFATLPGLPAEPVRVTVRLSAFPEQTLEVTPKPVYLNGPDCGGGGPQATLHVDANGVVSA
jgi:hypothetical protein